MQGIHLFLSLTFYFSAFIRAYFTRDKIEVGLNKLVQEYPKQTIEIFSNLSTLFAFVLYMLCNFYLYLNP